MTHPAMEPLTDAEREAADLQRLSNLLGKFGRAVLAEASAQADRAGKEQQ